jgi:putative membrane protein
VGAVAGAAGVVTVAGMIATPLMPQGGRARRMLSTLVVVGSFTTTTANAVRRWGVPRAAAAGVFTATATTAVERIGTQTGLPFGRYAYTGALQPQVAHVPAIVPLAWFAMGLPAREAAHAALGARSNAGTRIVLGSAALTAWDLFLDPQMVGEGYWVWARRGLYRGIPLGNFLGWFVTGLGVMAALEALLPPSTYVDGSADADGALVGEYAYMGVMETIGFARFFRDPTVAVVGGLGMLPIAAGAVLGKFRG